MEYFEAVARRRTYYTLGKNIALSLDRIREIVEFAAMHTPTAFNCQNGRAVILFGEEHEALWRETVTDTLRKIVPEAVFPRTEKKLLSFAQAFCTILFYEDMNTVREQEEKMPTYRESFAPWSRETVGIMQHIVWTGLESEGVCCSLQHYNPLIDDAVALRWSIPQGWRLVTEMVCGSPEAEPMNKTFLPLEGRVRVITPG